MQKNITKTESVTEFLARGGKVNKLPFKARKAKVGTKVRIEDIDLSALPKFLKLKYGVK